MGMSLRVLVHWQSCCCRKPRRLSEGKSNADGLTHLWLKDNETFSDFGSHHERLSPQWRWGCGARERCLRALAPLHLCRISPSPGQRRRLPFLDLPLQRSGVPLNLINADGQAVVEVEVLRVLRENGRVHAGDNVTKPASFGPARVSTRGMSAATIYFRKRMRSRGARRSSDYEDQIVHCPSRSVRICIKMARENAMGAMKGVEENSSV
jgi:hypothetical protein